MKYECLKFKNELSFFTIITVMKYLISVNKTEDAISHIVYNIITIFIIFLLVWKIVKLFYIKVYHFIHLFLYYHFC